MRLHVERLESREVPSATANLTNRILYVNGTEGDDVIFVGTSGRNLTVEGRTFAASAVDLIVISGQSGNDRITVTAAITKSTRIFGESGADTILGGNGPDEIYGGSWNDVIISRGGVDTVYGGAGSDTIDSGPGNDLVYEGQPGRPQWDMSEIEAEILRLTNIERRAAGLSDLRFNAALNRAANLHAGNMAERSQVVGNAKAHSHTLIGSSLPTLTMRLNYAGYSYSGAGENIAYGFGRADLVVAAWMNSPGHRANILDANFTDIGIGVAYNASGTPFFSQDFGTPI